MPVNAYLSEDLKVETYKPSKDEKDFLLKLQKRLTHLKDARKVVKANPYDTATRARTIEELWDFCDYVALPHKYGHRELQSWQADNSRPLIYAKIETALAIILAKNPEVELAARSEKWEKKTELMKALYNLSWDQGEGSQQLTKFVYNLAKYGFAVGREYHRFETSEVEEITSYDPEGNKHITEMKEVVVHDEPYFESLPVRDCYFDDRAKPYDEDSMRDWYFERTYDYSTLLKSFPAKKFPNIKYIQPAFGGSQAQDSRDKADIADDTNYGPQARLVFYEDRENNEFVIVPKDCTAILYRGPLLNNELSCVIANWRIRNDQCIYGIGLCEILENSQELLDVVSNSSINQVILAIGGAGFYGGSSTITKRDGILEPKIKKLKDAEKIIFPRIPMPDANVYTALEDIRNEADYISGVTQSLEGEQVGRTLGEAVLNREAGLRRLAIPLKNIQYALERHANLRINLIQQIYSRPVSSMMVRDAMGQILDEKLWQEYNEERAKLGENSLEFINKFPSDDVTGAVFRNQFRTERLPLEKAEDGTMAMSKQDQWLEITPEEIKGEYDIRVRAMSTIPVSQALEEARALETFQIVAPLPNTDIYKAERTLLKSRGDDPDDWMKTEEEIIQAQQAAQQEAQLLDQEGQAAQAAGIPTEGANPMQMEPPAQTQAGNSFSKAFGGL